MLKIFLFQTARGLFAPFSPVNSVPVALPEIFGNKKGCNLVSVTILYCNRAHSFYQTQTRPQSSQDDAQFVIKFLGFASPPHDGFADKYSIVTKEKLQAVYATPPIFAIIIHVARLLVKSFLKKTHNFYLIFTQSSQNSILFVFFCIYFIYVILS